MKALSWAAVATAALVLGAAGQASALTTISSGGYSVGIASNGELLSLKRTGDSYDVVAPGTARDSWGLNAAFADGQYLGVAGVMTTLTSSSTSGAVLTSLTDDGFQIVQTYSFFGDNILKIATEVTNLNDVATLAMFQRNVDWDFGDSDGDPAGASNDNIFGAIGTNAFVHDATTFGFEDAAGSGDYVFAPCLDVCTAEGLGDNGAGIRLNLGSLASLATARFSYFYGLSAVGQGVDSPMTGLIAQTQNAGATYLLAGQSAESGDYPSLGANSATLGVSDVLLPVAVPEPATWAMMLTGFFGLGSLIRRRRALTA